MAASKIEFLLHADTCIIFCSACQLKTFNKFLRPSVFQTQCLQCGAVGEWSLDDTRWTGLPEVPDAQGVPASVE